MAEPWNLLVFAVVDAAQLAVMEQARKAMRNALVDDRCRIGMQVVGPDHFKRYWMTTTSDNEESIPAAEEHDTSKPECLMAFLNASTAQLEDRSTALVIYAHGSGLDYVQGFLQVHGHWPKLVPLNWPALLPVRHGGNQRIGPDPTSNEFLSNVALRDGIAMSNRARVDVLVLNACWMGEFEILHELRKVCSVVVASQVFAEVLDYGDLVEQLSTRDLAEATDVGKLVVERVRDQIANNKRHDAISACATSGLNDLYASIDTLAGELVLDVQMDPTNIIDAIANTIRRVDDPNQVDMGSMLQKCGASDATYKAVIIANAADPAFHPGATGLNIFCPATANMNIDGAYAGLDFAANRWALFLKTVAPLL